MSRNKVTVLSLYLTDDEISSFRESIAQSPDFPCKLICSKSYCEFKAILSQQLVDVVTLGYPFKESEVSEWLIQSPSQRVIIFNDTKDHLAVEKIVPEKSFIHLDRETNETYLQSALQLIRWVTSPKSSEKHTLSADELIDNLGFVSVKVNESGIIQSVNEAFCKLLSC